MTTVRKDMVIDISAQNHASTTIAQVADDAVAALEKTAAARRQVATQAAQEDAAQQQRNARARDAMAELQKIQRADMAKAQLQGLNQNLADLAKVTKVMGALSLAADGFGVAASGASLASAYFTGDLKKMTEAAAALDAQMQALPFGFNKVYALGTRIGGLFFGDDKGDAARINAQTEAITKAYDKLADSAKKYRDAAMEAARRQADLMRESEKLRNPDQAGVLAARDEMADRLAAAEEARKKMEAAADEEAKSKRAATESQQPREEIASEIANARRNLESLLKQQGTVGGINTESLISEARARLKRAEDDARAASSRMAKIDSDLAAEKARIAAESEKEKEMIRANARIKEEAAQKEAADRALAIERARAKALADLQSQSAREIAQARTAAEVLALRDQGRMLEAETLQAQASYREKIRALNTEMESRRTANPELGDQIAKAQLAREAELARERDAAIERARVESERREVEWAERRDRMLLDSQSKLIEKQKEMEGDGLAARIEANKRAYDQMREQAIAAFKGRTDAESQAALRQLMRNMEAQQKADADKLMLDERTAQAKGIRQGGFAAKLIDNSFVDLAGRNNPMLTELKATSESNRKQATALEKMVDLTQKLLDKFGAGAPQTAGFGLGSSEG
jgi:hypothetical protein